MAQSVSLVPFAILAFAVVGGAVGMLTARNVVHAAYWLLEVSLAAAGLYWLVGSGFIALVQVLVYAGAVSILLIFTILITLRRREDAIRPVEFSAPAALLAVVFATLVITAVSRSPIDVATAPETLPDMARFSVGLFRDWMLPFELASLVLLVALIAAVWWTRSGGEGE